jgi:hypothetical protein
LGCGSSMRRRKTIQEFPHNLKGRQPNPRTISNLEELRSGRGRNPW